MHKRKSPKHLKVVSLSILVVILVAGASVWVYMNYFSNKTDTVPSSDYASASDMLTQASKLSNSGKDKEAQALIEAQTQYIDDPSVKLAYARSLAANGNTDKAISTLQKLAGDDKAHSYIYLKEIAMAFELADRNSEALSYYQKTIDAAKASVPVDDDQAFEVANVIADCEYYVATIKASL